MLVLCHMHLSIIEVCIASLVGVLYQVAVSSVSIVGGGIITGCWLLFVHGHALSVCMLCTGYGRFCVGTDIIWRVFCSNFVIGRFCFNIQTKSLPMPFECMACKYQFEISVNLRMLFPKPLDVH